jgi:2-polyprenyl-6-methoxyphenol hydroxylase-like FAD-dependent oxidoreductase
MPSNTPSDSFRVGIIGGGIAGLALAQGLKKAGIAATVFERDRTRSDRLQGYRVHISPAGARAPRLPAAGAVRRLRRDARPVGRRLLVLR